MDDPALKPVLYVDDEENDGLLLQLAFERARVAHPLHVVTDGVFALDYLFGTGAYTDRARHPLPLVMLLDFKLPRMGALQVLERVRQAPEFRQLPVIVFSSSEQRIDQERAKELGADEYLVKPSGMEGFVAIAELLKERWLAAPGVRAETRPSGGP